MYYLFTDGTASKTLSRELYVYWKKVFQEEGSEIFCCGLKVVSKTL